MSTPKYREKMNKKKEIFKNVELLENYNEMLYFLQKLNENKNENKINK
jgi:hypothetical protein